MARDTRTIYVSASGNDANSGTSPNSPKRTIQAGVGLLRHGMPDQMLVKRGDTFDGPLGQWKLSGRSLADPIRVSTYGTGPRPLLLTGVASGIWTSGSGSAPTTNENVIIQGLSFKGTGEAGLQFLQASNHIAIEDCRFDGYGVNVVVQGFPEGVRHTDFLLKDCELVNARSREVKAQGLYAYAVDGLTIEGCLVENCGNPNIYSHGLYIDNGNTGVTVRNCRIRESGSHGLQLRCGGTVQNNEFARNPIACAIGGGEAPEPNGVECLVAGNRILDGRDISPDLPRGWGLWFANIASGMVSNNTIAFGSGGQQAAIQLDGNHHDSVGVHGLRFQGNCVYKWGGGVQVQGNVTGTLMVGWVGDEPK